MSFPDNAIVADLQGALDSAYQSAYGSLPALPLTPPGKPFQYQPDSPQQEVYYFFYVANRMRQQVASVLNGSGAGAFPTWVQEVINAIGFGRHGEEHFRPDRQRAGRAGDQRDGEDSQLAAKHDPALRGGGGGGPWRVSGGACGHPRARGKALGGLVLGAGATLASDFIGQAGVPDYENLTVPVTPITNNILNAGVLSDLATNITNGVSTQWQYIQQARTAPRSWRPT